MEIFSLWASYLLLGVFAGVLAGLLGVGGGLINVPILALMFSLQGFAPEHLMQLEVGTSAASGLPIALVGALGFVVVGVGRADLPVGSTGFVYWPAVTAISIASVLSAPLGARLAHHLDQARLKKVFATFIALLGLLMLGKSLLG